MINTVFSLITPVYNRTELLFQMIDSVRNQVFCNWELIIVDDGSTDGTEAFVLEYFKKDARFQCVDVRFQKHIVELLEQILVILKLNY